MTDYPQVDIFTSDLDDWQRCEVLGIGVGSRVVALENVYFTPPTPPDDTGTSVAENQVLFDDGTFGFFNVHSGCVIDSAYGYSGKGCRMTPDPSTGITSLTSSSAFPGGQPWASLAFWFRLVTSPSLSDTYMNLFEIGNAVPAAPKSQFTVYFNAGSLYMDFNAPESTLLAAAPTDGGWHRIEARVYFGDTTYVANARLDGGSTVTLTSGSGKTPSTAEVLWVHYPSTAVDYTMDADEFLLTTAASDPGWVTT